VKVLSRDARGTQAQQLSRRALRSVSGALARAHDRVERRLQPAPRAYPPYVASVGAAFETGFTTCPCLFVLSTGRTGTDTLAALLHRSDAVAAVHEPQPKLVQVSYGAYMTGAADSKWRQIVIAARGEQVAYAAMHGKVYAETNNRMTYLADALAAGFPASRFIHQHRHPYDVVYSCLRRNHYAGHPWDYARVRPRDGDPYAGAWDEMATIEKVAWYWMEINRLALDFGRRVPAGRFMDLPSRLLFEGDAATIEAIFRVAGVETPEVLEIEEVLGVPRNRQVGGASVKAPADWEPAQRHAVNAIVGDVAAELGYELF
jgi:hypothetical protein